MNANDDEVFTYDGAGRLLTRRVRSNEVFTYSYDRLGRVTRVAAPSGTHTTVFTYDNFSNLLTVTGGGRTITHTWNALGELLSQAQPTGTVSYQYDGAGRRSRLTWSDGFYVTADEASGNRAEDEGQGILRSCPAMLQERGVGLCRISSRQGLSPLAILQALER